MRALLIDILRGTVDEVWPTVEHSLGLMYLSAALKERFGDTVHRRIWTLLSKPDRHEEERTRVLEVLKEWSPDLVGIRCLSIGKDSLRVVVKAVKEWNEECFVVVGGPLATDDPEGVLLETQANCVVVGEGENTLNELVGRLRGGSSFEDVPGMAYRQGGRIVRSGPRALVANLDALPLPDYSAIDLDAFRNRYLTFSSKIYQRHANILTTRGCPYRCMYCHNILGKQFRARSAESVLSEIAYLHDRYGITDIQVVDDIFNLDAKRAKAICDLIVRSGMRLTLSFPNGVRGDLMDEDLIDKMAAAGTRFMSYAVETASPRLQRMIRKNLDLDKVFRAIEYTTKVGIATRGFFMLGFPSETEEEANRTIEFAKDSSLCGATFFTVVYFPGTELHQLARSMGYFSHKESEVQRDYVQVGEGPYAFSLETLVQLKKKAIRQFAFTRDRIERALRVLPAYFTPREIDGVFMAYVVSSGATFEELEDETVRRVLRRHFVVAKRFSRGNEFYV